MIIKTAIFRKTIAILSAATVFAVSTAAAQAACMQNRSIYSDSNQNYTLTFSPSQKTDDQSSNSFTIIANTKPEFKLQGNVQWTEGVSRPTAMITYNCASDEMAEDEIDDCTIWQGVVYALKDGADAELLPRNDEPAAAALLFPDFVSMLDSYDFGAAKPAEPLNWEVFRFKACTPE